MDAREDEGVSRRAFIKAGIATTAVAGIQLDAWADEAEGDQAKPQEPLPRRELGRTGEKVTILSLARAVRPPPGC